MVIWTTKWSSYVGLMVLAHGYMKALEDKTLISL